MINSDQSILNEFSSFFHKFHPFLSIANQDCLKEFHHVVKSCKINQSSDIPHKVTSRTCETHLAVKKQSIMMKGLNAKVLKKKFVKITGTY